MTASSPVQRISGLDALRGLAAMIVVFHHIWVLTPYSIDGNRFPENLLVAGHGAVCLFFVLSGLVLSYRQIGNPNCYQAMVKAIVKRPFRLAAVTAPVSILFFAFCGTWSNGDQIDRMMMTIRQELIHCPVALGSVFNVPLWSIQVEIVGSLIVFIMVMVTCRLTYSHRILTLLAVAVFLEDTFYWQFLAGMIIGEALKRRKEEDGNHYWMLLLLPLGLWLFSFPRGKDILEISAQSVTSSTGAILLLLVVGYVPLVQRLVTIRPIMFLGEISFSLYVTHWFWVVSLHPDVVKLYQILFGKIPIAMHTARLTEILLNIVSAWLLTRYVDIPGTKMAGKIADKITGRNAEKVEPSCNRG